MEWVEKMKMTELLALKVHLLTLNLNQMAQHNMLSENLKTNLGIIVKCFEI